MDQKDTVILLSNVWQHAKTTNTLPYRLEVGAAVKMISNTPLSMVVQTVERPEVDGVTTSTKFSKPVIA